MPTILHENDPHEPLLSEPGIAEVSFDLPRIVPEGDEKDPTKNLRLAIRTLLSFWVRTINKRSTIPEWKINSPSALRRNEVMEMEMRVVPKTVFLRIVASERTGDREEYTKLHFLEQWLETPVYRVPCPTGEVSLSRSGGALGIESQPSSSWEHLVHHHPVFGVGLSSLFDNNIHDSSTNQALASFTDGELRSIERASREKGFLPWCAKFNYDTYGSFNSFLDATQNVNNESQWIDGNPAEEQWRKHAEQVAYIVNKEDSTQTELKADEPRGKDEIARTEDIIITESRSEVTAEKIYRHKDYLRRRIQPELAIHCQGSLVQNCAQEIFSAFFLELISGVDKIHGTTVLVVKPGSRMEMEDMGFSERRHTWVNDVIDKIAKVLYDCSLVDSQMDGRNLIVPGLATHRGVFQRKTAGSYGQMASKVVKNGMKWFIFKEASINLSVCSSSACGLYLCIFTFRLHHNSDLATNCK
ncbi:hypothetical protein DL95DRAFT_490070 [Leptodontidium sp. 2 PMI_412]|nr:hypothetical protein DL95DRAFT_490070 [Leptodontidium sp. 2 PMI_412]